VDKLTMVFNCPDYRVVGTTIEPNIPDGISKMFVFHFIFLYFYFLICIIDSLIDYDLKRNTEIVKWEGNVVNGPLGMKRDANLQSIEFFHSYDDVKAVLIGS
jgi:hypothetical protein